MKQNKYLYLLLALGFTLILDNQAADNVHASVNQKYQTTNKSNSKKIKVNKHVFDKNVTFTIKDKDKKNKKIRVNKDTFDKNVTFNVRNKEKKSIKKTKVNKNVFDKNVSFKINNKKTKVNKNNFKKHVTFNVKNKDKQNAKRIKVNKDVFDKNVNFTIKDKDKKIRVNKHVFDKNVTFDVKKKLLNQDMFKNNVTFNIPSSASSNNVKSSAASSNSSNASSANSSVSSSSNTSSSSSQSSPASASNTNTNTSVANSNSANSSVASSASIQSEPTVQQTQADADYNSLFRAVPDDYNYDIPWEKDDSGHDYVAKSFGNTIYYHTNNLDNNYQNYVSQAIQDWNNLGVINLQPSNDNNQIGININYDTSNNENGTYGVTYFNGSGNFKNNNEVLNTSTINLKPLLNNLGSDSAIKYTIEHEIGHALGFAHDDRKNYSNLSDNVFQTYVMYATDSSDNTASVSTIPLGQREANALKQHYSN